MANILYFINWSYALRGGAVVCMFAAPLNEVGVLYPNGETLFPDVDGLVHPSMPQLGRHIVYVKDPRKLTDDMWDTEHGYMMYGFRKHQYKESGFTLT